MLRWSKSLFDSFGLFALAAGFGFGFDVVGLTRPFWLWQWIWLCCFFVLHVSWFVLFDFAFSCSNLFAVRSSFLRGLKTCLVFCSGLQTLGVSQVNSIPGFLRDPISVSRG